MKTTKAPQMKSCRFESKRENEARKQVNTAIDGMMEVMQENEIDLGKLSIDELVDYCLSE